MEAEALSRAIGAIVPIDDRSSSVSGTAFAISNSHALTAFHCVGNRASGLVTTPSARIRFSAKDHADFEVDQFDPTADVALLRLREQLPGNRQPLRLALASSLPAHARFLAPGFPKNWSFSQDPVPMVGYVADPLATILDGVPAIALESTPTALGMPIHGFSGAPVMVNVNPLGATEGDRQAVIGLIRWAPTDAQQPDAALGGLLYASPSSATWKWDTVRPSFRQATTVRLPHETAIRNFVHQYLGDPGRPTPFGGRAQEIGRIEAWLNDPAAPRFMLVATRAGLGKSALLVRLCDRLESLGTGIRPVFVPITIRWELNGRTAVFEALAARLAAARGETMQGGIDAVESAAAKLRQASADGQQVVAVLDGLDEADGWDASPSLFPLDLGRGVRVIVAARLTADRPRPEDWLAALGWTAGNAAVLTLDPLTPSGVGEAITSMGPALAWLAQSVRAATLYRATAGDPLVLSLYLSDLLDRGPEVAAEALDELEQRKPGIASYMSAWWRDQEKLWGGPLSQQALVVRVVLNFLACALGPLPRRDLLGLVKSIAEVDTDVLENALRALRRFVIVDPKTQGYALSHPQLADVRRAQLDDEVSRYDQQFVDWGREAITALAQRTLRPADISQYLVRHYGAHLERANASPSDFLMLVGPDWRDAWDTVTDELDGAIRDVNRAQWRLAGENWGAVVAGGLPQYVDGYLSCAIWRATMSSRIGLVSAAFAGELVRHGLWPASRALALVRLLPSFSDRGFGLGALAPKLPRPVLALVEEMLGELQTADPLAFGAGFDGLIDAYCRQDGIDRARRLVDELPPGYAHGLGCVRLITASQGGQSAALLLRMPDDLAHCASLERGLLLDRLTASVARQTANEAFAPRSPESADEAARFMLPYVSDTGSADHLSSTGDWADVDPAWLSGLLPWLSPQTAEGTLNRVMTRLEESGDPIEIDIALEELGPHLDAPLAERAVALANAHLSSEAWRVSIFASLLKRLPAPRRRELRHWVVQRLSDALDNTGNHYERQALVSALVGEGLQNDLLVAIDASGLDSWSKDTSMEALAPYLQLDHMDRAVAVAQRARHEAREATLAPVLTRLASFSSDSAKRALDLAATLSQDSDERLAAQAVLVAATTPEKGIDAALEVADEDLRYAAIVGASVFSPISGKHLLRAVRTFGPAPNRLALSCFEMLVERLPDAEVRSEAGLAAARDVIHTGIHERKAQIVIRYFSRVASSATTEEVLALGRRLSTPSFDYPFVWALAGACVGSSNPDTSAIRRSIEQLKPGLHQAIAEASAIRFLTKADQRASWLGRLKRIDKDEAKNLPGRVAVLVELLPAKLKRATVDHLFGNDYLSGRQTGWALKDTWASELQDLVPVLERDHLELVLAACNDVNSSGSRNLLRAAVAAQLARVANLGEAFQVLDSLDFRYTLASLERMIDLVPDSTLPDVVGRAHAPGQFPFYRGERVRVWAKAVGRLPTLPVSTQWTMLENWLNQPFTLRELLVDLLCYGPVLIALGGPQVAQTVIDRLARQA